MAHSNIPRRDRWFAKLFTVAANSFGGDGSVERWHQADIAGSSIQNWIHFDGDPNWTSRNPLNRRFQTIGVMAVHKDEIDSLRAVHRNTRHAVALRFGEAVVVGAFAIDEAFSPNSDPERPNELRVAAGIGREALVAVPGLWFTDVRQFMPATTAEIEAVYARDALPADVARI